MQSYNKHGLNPSVPDTELFDRISNNKAAIPEIQAYYQQLKEYIASKPSPNEDFYAALNHYTKVELLLDSLNSSVSNYTFFDASYSSELDRSAPEDVRDKTSSASPNTKARLEQTYYKDKTLTEIESELLAAATQRNFKLALTKVAAANSLPLEAIEIIAKDLLQEKGLNSQYDIDKSEYQRCIDEIRELELQISDPGEKLWKMQALAKKYKRSRRDLLETYCKSLIAQHLAEPIKLQDLKDKYGDRRQWILRGWIPKASLILLHAHGGTGKTLFVQYLMKLLTSGEDWQEYKVQGKNSILYIQTDTSPTNLIESLKQVGITNDCPIQYHTDWQIDYTAQLYHWIKASRPALVVIDSLASVNRFTTISENDTEYARPILYLGDMAREFGCSFLILHHSNSEGKSRGSKAIRAAVDEEWNLETVNPKDPSDPERLLTMQKSRSRMPMKYKLKFDDDSFAWNLLEPEDEDGNLTQNSGNRWLIVDYLTKHPGQLFCPASVADALNKPESTIRRELPGLYREGLVDRELNPNFRDGRGGGQPKHYYTIHL